MWCSVVGSYADKARKVFDDLNHIFQSDGYEIIENLSKKVLDYLFKKFAEIWNKSHRIKAKVIQLNSDWLAQLENIFLSQSSKSSDRGRPKLSLAECSERTKRRRIAELAELNESAADDLRWACSPPNSSILPAKECEVVALITEANLTKHQYELIRSFVNSKIDANLFPCYNNVLKEKQKSYP